MSALTQPARLHHRFPPDPLALLALVLLLFPSGRPLSPRWRWLVYAVVLAIPTAVGIVGFFAGGVAGVAPVTRRGHVGR